MLIVSIFILEFAFINRNLEYDTTKAGALTWVSAKSAAHVARVYLNSIGIHFPCEHQVGYKLREKRQRTEWLIGVVDK